MNVLHVITFGAALAAATPAPTAKEIPQEVCKTAVHIVRDADVMCVQRGVNPGERSRLYQCFDKRGGQFIAVRTAGDKA